MIFSFHPTGFQCRIRCSYKTEFIGC